VFVGVHLPAYLADKGFAPHVAVIALALVGLFNIVGSYGVGVLGGRYSKKNILCLIYLGRAVVIGLFVLTPPTALTTLLFAAAMGVLWLSTVPPTNGIIAGVFGDPLPRDAVRRHVLQPPDRQLPRRVAGRLLLRPHRELRRRVDDLDRARNRRRAPEPPDRREGDPAAADRSRLISVDRSEGVRSLPAALLGKITTRAA